MAGRKWDDCEKGNQLAGKNGMTVKKEISWLEENRMAERKEIR